MKIQFEQKEATDQATSEELAKVLLARFGLLPRKKDGTAQMHRLLLELYERKKRANREKQLEAAVMPVEDMAMSTPMNRCVTPIASHSAPVSPSLISGWVTGAPSNSHDGNIDISSLKGSTRNSRVNRTEPISSFFSSNCSRS